MATGGGEIFDRLRTAGTGVDGPTVPGWAEAIGVCAASDGLRAVRISGDLIAGALDPAVRAMLSAVHEVLSAMPPDLAADVVTRGIQLAGGGALLLGLAERIEISTGIKTCVVDDPLRCVIRRAANLIEHDDCLRNAIAA